MSGDAALLLRLKAGDEGAFRDLVRGQHGRLLRLARGFCRGSRATAEEVVQESWLAVVTGLHRYTGEAPLSAWIAGIVVNKARTRAVRDGRMIAFSDLGGSTLDGEAGGGLDPDRFRADGHWNDAVAPWDEDTPERLAGDRQMMEHLAAALDLLPPMQRAVVTLRDVEGNDGTDVCRMLDLTEGNMRVLLHRGRTRLRASLETAMRPAHVTDRRTTVPDGGADMPGGGSRP